MCDDVFDRVLKFLTKRKYKTECVNCYKPFITETWKSRIIGLQFFAIVQDTCCSQKCEKEFNNKLEKYFKEHPDK